MGARGHHAGPRGGVRPHEAADTYDGDRPYVSLDTPVQALYREAVAQVASTFECACTCAGLAELERIAPTIGATGDVALMGSIAQCALRCMAEFARCED
jgi:hypothetical protein